MTHSSQSAFRAAAVVALIGVGGAAPPASAQLPTLAAAEASALVRTRVLDNPELVALRAVVHAAESRAAAAGFAQAAILDAQLEEYARDAGAGGSSNLRVGVNRDIVSTGVRRARRALATRDVERARLELALMERSLLARADQQLVTFASARAIAWRLAAEDSLLAGAEEALRARLSVGDARYVDVLRLRSERLRVQGERARAVADARVARVVLLSLATGDGAPSDEAAVDRALALQEGAAPSPLVALPPLDSLAETAGFVQLAAAVRARALTARDVLRAEQSPTLSAGFGLQRFPRDGGGARIGPTLNASMALPFTARRANAAALAAAARAVDAAEADRRAALAHVRATLRAAFERYEAARTQLALYDAALLRTAGDERQSALAAYRSGDLTLMELLDFERALSRAEIDRLRSRAAAAEALAHLVAGVAGVGDDAHGTPAELWAEVNR